MLSPLLDDQPDVLAPRTALERRRARWHDGRALSVSHNWRIVAHREGWIVQVDDPTRLSASQFALTATTLALLRRLVPGEHAPPELDWFTAAVLVDTGILTAASGDATDADVLRAANASYAAARCAVVPDALHPYDVATLRRYLRNRIRTGALPLGDPGLTRRHHAHNDPVARVCHERLLPLVTHVVGAPIKPSYVYVSAYTEGAVLPSHRDRAQCEYSVTLQVDYTPEPVLEAAWPLRLALPDGEQVVYLGLGDALVFAGREHAHFREPLPSGHISTSLLLHYVDADFEGSLE